MNLYKWAEKWNVPSEAIDDLRHAMGINGFSSLTEPSDVTSEAGVSKKVRLAFAHSGGVLWRNNVGVFTDERGVPVRYGLANESSQMNKRVKSSDLVGLRPVAITRDMVGSVIGQFVARETKRADWRYTGTPREVAQLKFMELVISKGGDAAFTTGQEY